MVSDGRKYDRIDTHNLITVLDVLDCGDKVRDAGPGGAGARVPLPGKARRVPPTVPQLATRSGH